MSVSIDMFNKLSDLFEFKKWEIETDGTKWSSLFNRFSSRLSLFDEEKQQLLIELGYRFRNIGINDFEQYFIGALNKVPGIQEYKTIIVVPLKKPSTKETKSADNIWYHLKNYVDFSYEWFGSRIYWESNWDKIRLGLKDDAIILLVDDFTGTGGTAKEVLDELYETKRLLPKNRVCVTTFMGQGIGIADFSAKYPDMMSCSLILNRAISDFYVGKVKDNNARLMEEIELKIKVNTNYKFGWGRSESLVALNNRSVNNTLPVFWLEKKVKYAPFKR